VITPFTIEPLLAVFGAHNAAIQPLVATGRLNYGGKDRAPIHKRIRLSP
jgi:hypothetical protein